MNATVENSEKKEALKKVLAYLKGWIVGNASKKGMKWKSGRVWTEEFGRGYEDGQKVVGYDFLHYDGEVGKWMSMSTAVHIIHNRLRHDRPHTGSVERDSAILRSSGLICGSGIKSPMFEIEEIAGNNLEVVQEVQS